MKIIVLRNNLKDSLAAAERGIGDSVNLPILKNFLINADNNNLSISATNLEIGVTARTSAKVIKSGSVAIPAGVFLSLVNTIQSERLDIEKKDSVLEIRCDNYEVTLPLSSLDEFPIIPKIENKKNIFKMNALVLSDALQKVLAAVQFSEIRPEISGILFDLNPSGLTLTGTDIFRLAEKKVGKSAFSSTYEEGVKCIIPLKTIQEFLRIFKQDKEVEFYFDDNQMLAKNENFEMISRLVNGNFPDYVGLKIIPQSFKTEVEVDREEFISAIKLSGAVSQTANDVKIKIGENKKNIELLSTEKSFGKTKAVLPAKVSGETTEIVFNWKYLFDGLKGMTDKAVVLGLNGDDKPALLKSADVSYVYVLMPAKQ